MKLSTTRVNLLEKPSKRNIQAFQEQTSACFALPEMESSNRLSKFVAEPEIFSGKSSKNPLSWLKQINRIRKATNMSDDQALLVASSHFRGQAQRWWDNVEETIDKWSDFEQAFKKQFASSQLEDF